MMSTMNIYKKIFLINFFILFSILILFIASSSHAQQVEKLSSSVVFMRSKSGENTFGTGFLIIKNDHLYLVTADHVSKILKIDSPITIRKQGDKPLTLKLSDLVGQSKLNWIVHHEGDVAVLHLKPIKEIRKYLQHHFLPSKILIGEKSAPPRSMILTVLGFPLALGVEKVFSPISRETKAASGLLELKRADIHKPSIFFIIQDPSIGGFSGAPLFDTGLPYSTEKAAIYFDKREVRIVGLVHGTISDNTGGKMGAIVPSYYIVETLSKAEGM